MLLQDLHHNVFFFNNKNWHGNTYAGIAGPGAVGAGRLGMLGAGLFGIEGMMGALEPPGLLGNGGGGALPGLGEDGLLQIQGNSLRNSL